MMEPELFLSRDQLKSLTGCVFSSKQIAWLKANGVPFFVTAQGRAVVTRVAVEGRQSAPEKAPETKWTPRVMRAG